MMKQPVLKSFSMRKRIVLWSALLVVFFLLVFLTSTSYINPSTDGILGLITRFHFEFMIGIAFLGVLIGAAGIYIFSSELEKTTDSLKVNTELLLSFLSKQEREVVQFIIDKGGQAFQADVSKIPGMTRLKAHRIITRLSDRQIIQVNSYGKANLITLSPVILRAFNLQPAFNTKN